MGKDPCISYRGVTTPTGRTAWPNQAVHEQIQIPKSNTTANYSPPGTGIRKTSPVLKFNNLELPS
jgi:hypothetical protein